MVKIDVLRANAAGEWPVFSSDPQLTKVERSLENRRRAAERSRASQALDYLVELRDRAAQRLKALNDKMQDKCIAAETIGPAGKRIISDLDPERSEHFRTQIEPLERDLEILTPAVDLVAARLSALSPIPLAPGNSDIDLQNLVGEMRASWVWCGLGEPGKAASGPFVDFVAAAIDLRAMSAPAGLGKRIQEQAARESWPGYRAKKEP